MQEVEPCSSFYEMEAVTANEFFVALERMTCLAPK
jgi:hypothetical protein